MPIVSVIFAWTLIALMLQDDRWSRFLCAQAHAGLHDRQLAKQLGVSVTSMMKWEINGIPSVRIRGFSTDDEKGTKKVKPAICSVLNVPASWIEHGENPPDWFIYDIVYANQNADRNTLVFTPMLISQSGDGLSEMMESVDACKKRKHSIVFHAWLDFLRTKLFDALAANDQFIPVPSRIGVRRWGFISNPFSHWIDQLTESEIRQLANHLQCWPKSIEVLDVVRSELDRHCPTLIQGQCSRDVVVWNGVIEKMQLSVLRYQKAVRDPQRRREAQADVYCLLDHPYPNELEPNCSGAAVIPILGEMIRAARSVEALGGHPSGLRFTLESALLGDLYNRPFLLADVTDILRRRAGLVVSDNFTHSSPQHGQVSISTDTILRELHAIRLERPVRIRLSLKGRTWRVVHPRGAKNRHEDGFIPTSSTP